MIEFLLVVIVWLVLNPLYYIVPLGIALLVLLRPRQDDDNGTETHG